MEKIPDVGNPYSMGITSNLKKTVKADSDSDDPQELFVKTVIHSVEHEEQMTMKDAWYCDNKKKGDQIIYEDGKKYVCNATDLDPKTGCVNLSWEFQLPDKVPMHKITTAKFDVNTKKPVKLNVVTDTADHQDGSTIVKYDNKGDINYVEEKRRVKDKKGAFSEELLKIVYNGDTITYEQSINKLS